MPVYRDDQPYPLTGRLEPNMVVCVESYIGDAESGRQEPPPRRPPTWGDTTGVLLLDLDVTPCYYDISMATVVERLGDLGDLLDELAAADLDTLSDGELDTLTIGLERARSRLALIAAIPLARWDARAVWVTDGSRNASCRLSRDTRSSINTARRQLVRAHHLADMAPTAAAILAGELSIDHFDLFALARSDREAHFARDEQTLVAECSKLRFGDAVQVANYWKYRADAERTETEAAERNKLHAATTLGGTVVLNGELDAVSGAVVTNELDRLMRQIKFEDVQLGVGRTVTQRRAAALVEMARRSSGATGLSARPLSTCSSATTPSHACANSRTAPS